MERVKPIQWVLSKDNSWKSAGALLHYAIIKHGGHWYIQYPNDDPLRRYNRPLWTFCDADSAKRAVAVHYEDYLYATLESILSQFEPEGDDSLSDEYLDFQEKKILRNYPQIKNLRPVGNKGW